MSEQTIAINTAVFIVANRTRMHHRLGWVGLTKASKRSISKLAAQQRGYIRAEECMSDDTLNPMFHYDCETHARAAALTLECEISGINAIVQ